MSIRAVFSALLLGVIVAFIALNQNNACDISFGFKVLTGVPVYLTVLSSVVFGMLIILPLSLFRRKGGSASRFISKKKSSADSGLLNEAASIRKADGGDVGGR